MSEEHDSVIEEIVRHSTEKAESLFPKRPISLRMKIVLLFLAAIVVASGVLSIVNTAISSQVRSCQTSQNQQITALRNSNTSATSTWINDVTNSLSEGKISVALLNQLRNQYNAQVSANSATIDKIHATKCQ